MKPHVCPIFRLFYSIISLIITHTASADVVLSDNVNQIPIFNSTKAVSVRSLSGGLVRLISVEDVRNYLSHIMYILIFSLLLKFSIICQTPDSNISNKMLEGGIMVSERQMRFNVNL